jgi:(1->4)-alpha-D-glucan 1-alpha-D-glucosylmutase
MTSPRATYRLQFSKSFGFEDAAKVADYLASLGVSHVYASPFLKARSGSPHGYDIVDHNELHPELGTQTDFDSMRRALQRCELGLILDYVPNHMGVGGADNPQWLDVLEWGKASLYAEWFDIDWSPESPYLRNKVLVPFLGEQYGAALQQGHLRLRFDAQEGSFSVWAYETHKLPISPLDYAEIVGDSPVLERIGDEFAAIGEAITETPRRAAGLKSKLALAYSMEDKVRRALDGALAQYEGLEGDLTSWSTLDRLIQRQHWRPAYFRVAADDINYRRFFNINDLAGIRMELPDLFDHAHKLVGQWLTDSTLDGLRIDHIDGLFDPKQYLERLRRITARPFHLVVEKILAQHESLREDWPVDGTTGYDFASQVTSLLVNPTSEAALSTFYAQFTGNAVPFDETVRRCKLRIMDNELDSELHALARDAARVARQNPLTSDFTQNILQRAMRQMAACFPVYRTYVSDDGPAETDLRYMDWAIELAERNEPELDPSVFQFLRRLLTTELVEHPQSGYSRHTVLNLAKKFQQFTSPVMAKGYEDTAFFTWNRLLALNEVGSDPGRFGIGIAAFHKANGGRGKRWPGTMVATSTHDTKRGEDVRARLAVLTELPSEWEQQVNAWSRLLRSRRADLDASAPPSWNDEYLFYQLLVGSWPVELTGNAKCETLLHEYIQRLQAVTQKSIREARTHSNWISPNREYEGAVAAFIRDALDPSRSEAFLSAFLAFEERVACYGVQNSLVQLVLKLTSPGIPDIYQGSELWELNLGDPDSRRPVDYASRAEQLASVRAALDADRGGSLRKYFAQWRDGSIKMATIALLLDARKAKPELFSDGSYEPLTCTGPYADRICAFVRRAGAAAMLVAVSLFPAGEREPVGWQKTRIPAALDNGVSREFLTNRPLPAGTGSTYSASDLFADLPVSVLLLPS